MRWQPILTYIVGIAAFAAMDATMKALLMGHSVLAAINWRYWVAFVFTVFLWWRAGCPRLSREMWPGHMVRGLFMALSAFFFFFALTRLPLAEVVTLCFIAPLLIPPLAALLLREPMEGKAVSAGLLGFVGVLVAVGFNPAELASSRLLAVGAALVSAATYAISLVLMRRRARDGAAIVSLMGTLIPSLLVMGPFFLTTPISGWLPQGDAIWLAFLAGFFGAVAFQFLARAYAQAQAQQLAPFEYTTLLWASVFGWFFFDEAVAWRTWVGALIIAIACLWQVRNSQSTTAV